MKNDYVYYLFIIKLLPIIFMIPIIESANILAVFPSVFRSHYIFGTTILQKLASNGHNITIITGLTDVELYPIQKQNIFYKEIMIPLITQNWIDNGLSFEFEDIKKLTFLEYFTRMVYAFTSNTDIILSNPKVQELILNSDNKFDLIIGDIFLGDAYLGFTDRFNCSLVVVSPNGNNKWIDEMTGNPYTSSRNPSKFYSLSEEMNFYERIQNTLMNIFEKFSYNFFHIMYHEKIYQRYFKRKRKTLPSLKSLINNIDLVLLNSNPVTEYPNAFLPYIIEVGGAHINQYRDKMPLDILKFIEESSGDVIYINFGANLNTSDLPDEKFKELLKLISLLEELNIRVILRWERFEKPLNSVNLFVKYWLPQQEILAHPKVKLFITSGGSMSIMEAVFYEKFIIGVPILPQHIVNLKRIQAQGYGSLIENYEHLNNKTILNKIQDLFNNETYYKNNKLISNRFKNVPIDPMNLSTYYIELLIKEKRFNYLKSSYNQMNFIQRELIDVILIILLGTIVIIGLPSIVICFILRKSNDYSNNHLNNNNNKNSNSHNFKNNRSLSNINVDTSASAFLKKLIKSKNIDVKNKNKFKRN